jgi:hypothetical protein
MDYLIFNLNAATRERIICELQNQFARSGSICRATAALMPESVLEREKFMCIWPFEEFRQRKNEIWSTYRKHNARRVSSRRPSFASGADGYIILYMRASAIVREQT